MNYLPSTVSQPETLVSTGVSVSLKAVTSFFVLDKNRLGVALRAAVFAEANVADDASVFRLEKECWETSATHFVTRGCEDIGLHLHTSKSSSCLWNIAVGLNKGRAKCRVVISTGKTSNERRTIFYHSESSCGRD